MSHPRSSRNMHALVVLTLLAGRPERRLSDQARGVAVIVASFVYHAANREAHLPRKPLPQPSTDGRVR